MDPTINYFPNFPNNPPPISRSMYGRQQLPSELNRQNSVLLDLQELLAEIVDGPRGNRRQRRRTVRQQGDGVDDLRASGSLVYTICFVWNLMIIYR